MMKLSRNCPSGRTSRFDSAEIRISGRLRRWRRRAAAVRNCRVSGRSCRRLTGGGCRANGRIRVADHPPTTIPACAPAARAARKANPDADDASMATIVLSLVSPEIIESRIAS